jgi:hypothetical protein
VTAVVLVIIVVAVLIIVALAVKYLVRQRRPDTVEVFQRQIDALSPEARKPVVEQVQQLDERAEKSDEPPEEDDRG